MNVHNYSSQQLYQQLTRNITALIKSVFHHRSNMRVNYSMIKLNHARSSSEPGETREQKKTSEDEGWQSVFGPNSQVQSGQVRL